MMEPEATATCLHLTPEYYHVRLKELEGAGPTEKDLANTTICSIEFIMRAERRYRSVKIYTVHLKRRS